MKFEEYIQTYLTQGRLLTDGAMGTYYEKKYEGRERLVELENLYAPERIYDIHSEYIKSGARLIRTNTFACNTVFMDDMQQVEECLKAGWQIAGRAVEESGENVIVAADIGPIPEMGYDEADEIFDEYKHICDVFLAQGAKVFVFETQSDFTYITPIAAYLKEQEDVFVMVQFSCDKSGYTKMGISAERIIRTAAIDEHIDAYGFNCGMDAAHLYQMLQEKSFPNEKYVMALPNAGYPYTLRGKTIYSSNEEYYTEMMTAIAGLGMDIIGGCCGTTPKHIARLAEALSDIPKTNKKIGSNIESTEWGKGTEFERKLQNREKMFVVELEAPFDANTEKVLEGARILKDAGVDMITISDSPMARPRMDAMQLAAAIQREVQVPMMPHLCCRDKNVIGIRSVLLGAYMNELRHFLFITGDPVTRDARGQISGVYDFNSIRLMEYAAGMNEDVFSKEPIMYGGALNYHGANPDAIIRRMQQKMDAGCECFLTQPIYSKEDIEQIAYIKERSDAKIICGIMPLVSYRNAQFVANEMPGIFVPEEIVTRYREDMTREEAEEVATQISVEIADKLAPYADGYYFMTPFNRAGLIARIMTHIKKG